MIEAAGILLVSPAGRVLLLKRLSEGDAQGLWALPGGKVEKGETALQAALRETWRSLVASRGSGPRANAAGQG